MTRPLHVALSLIVFSSFPLFADTGFLAQQAQLAWQDRDKPGQTEAAIGLWKQAVKAEPGRAELWIALARAQGRALRHASTSKEVQTWADEAIASAEHAVKLAPSNSNALAIYGEALGQWANAHKGIHSLARVKQAVDALQKAIALDPKNSYAHMLLAEFYRQSPRHISVGDKEKALAEARRAVQEGPEYAINHLALSRALLDLNKKDEAIAELKTILTLSAPPNVIPETKADQETAHELLQSLGVVVVTSACSETSGMCTQGQP